MSQTDIEFTCYFYSISRDLANKLSAYCIMSFLLTNANAKSNYKLETCCVDKNAHTKQRAES